MDDLWIICPNGHYRAVVEAMLKRRIHLGIREITFRVTTPAVGGADFVLDHAAQLAKGGRPLYSHCIVLVGADHCSSDESPEDTEARLDAALAETWGKDAKAIVLEPCLESWLIHGHRAFAQVPTLRGADVRRWVAQEGLWPNKDVSPDDPADLLRRVFRAAGTTPTPASYRRIAKEMPLRQDRLVNPSLRRFLRTLRSWFLP